MDLFQTIVEFIKNPTNVIAICSMSLTTYQAIKNKKIDSENQRYLTDRENQFKQQLNESEFNQKLEFEKYSTLMKYINSFNVHISKIIIYLNNKTIPSPEDCSKALESIYNCSSQLEDSLLIDELHELAYMLLSKLQREEHVLDNLLLEKINLCQTLFAEYQFKYAVQSNT